MVALSGENGILRQASKAKEETAKAEEKEQEDLKELEQQIILNTEVWNGTVGNSYAGGIGSKEDPYLIENGEQLAYLAEQVNNGEKYTGKYFKIIKSINLGGANWIPIGGNTEDVDSESNNYFDGELDGQDNLIANLSIIQNNTKGIGLIGILGENGLIKNIKVSSGNVTGKKYIGAIVGVCSGQVSNCLNNAKISTNGKRVSNHGGIVGWLKEEGKVTSCTNQGEIKGNGIGGIVGSIEVGTVENCINKGNISVKGSFVGGISGYTGSFINCVNQGNIEGVSYIGGIAPLIFGEIKNVSNTGKVYAKGSEAIPAMAGGIAIQIVGTLENAYNSGTVEVENLNNKIGIAGGIVAATAKGQDYIIKYSYNKGEIIGTDKDILGNIVGQRMTGSTIENCYYYTESETKGIGSESDDMETKNPVEDTIGVTEKVEDNIETYEEFLTWIEGKKE